jgi:mono/diheme cytochrome c family protein
MTFIKVMGFSLFVLLSYTLFANILPQVQSDPPAEEEVALDTLDRAGQIAWGEKLFAGKGTCTLCHNNLGRAPDLLAMDLAQVLPTRLIDSESGDAAIEAYLRESLLEPSAMVVSGFGKKGTNDQVSPMPAADGPPISLEPAELDAVIAYLQNLAGLEVTVALPSETDLSAGETSESEAVEDDAPAATAEAAIDKFICAGCHDLMGSGVNVGPRLGGIGERLDRAGIREAILAPNAVITEGFNPDFMPQNYGDQMRAGELEILIDYLADLPPAPVGDPDAD